MSADNQQERRENRYKLKLEDLVPIVGMRKYLFRIPGIFEEPPKSGREMVTEKINLCLLLAYNASILYTIGYVR